MKLSNQADVDRWLDLHVETATGVLREAGFTEDEIARIAAGEALWTVMLERLEHWKEDYNAAMQVTDRRQVAAQILTVVDHIRNADRWALAPLGHLLARLSVSFKRKEFDEYYLSQRQQRTSRKQRDKPKSLVTHTLADMMQEDDARTWKDVEAVLNKTNGVIVRADVEIKVLTNGLVRFADSLDKRKKPRDVTPAAVDKALRRLRKGPARP